MTQDKRGKPSSRRDGERGLALIIVLWIVAAVALLVSAFNASVRSGVAFMRSEVRLFEAQALVDAGLEIAAARLVDREKGRRWKADGRIYRVTFMGQELRIRISDANGRIDLNTTSGDVLVRLFAEVLQSEADAQRLCEVVVRARGTSKTEGCGGGAKKAIGGEDDQKGDPTKTSDAEQSSSDPSRSKSARSAKAQRRDGAKSSPSARELAFLDVADLRNFPEFRSDLFARLEQYLTVYNGGGLINAFTAPDMVLAALPRLTTIELNRFRQLRRDDTEDKEAAAEILDPAAAYLTQEEGPAYVIDVATAQPGKRDPYSRQFVIVLGLDDAAPYRLVASRYLLE